MPESKKDTHSDWAKRLGLTANSLFGFEAPRARSHFVLLDGVGASFLLSEDASLDRWGEVLDCTWSANVRTHVHASSDQITITRLNARESETFSRRSVEARLPEFLEFIEKSSKRGPLTSVEHVLTLFRKHKDTVGEGRERDWYIASFLYLLALSQTRETSQAGTPTPDVLRTFRIDLNAFDPTDITSDYIERFLFELRHSTATDRRLLSALTVRHAGGQLFQEAHSEALSPPGQLQFWGLSGGGARRFDLSQGVYYTPPGLARTLSDLAIQPHLHKSEVVISDPACGSGLFLCEAIRALQRAGYRGRVRLTGIDLSHTAAHLARFCLASAQLDWPGADITWDVRVGDYLQSKLDRSPDIIVMNPPFLAWEAMSKEMRAEVGTQLGPVFAGRPDLSMAFIAKALRELAPNGTTATLLPRGVLESKYGQQWRASLLHDAELRLVAVFGESNLFRHATVSVGAVLFQKTPSNEPTLTLWADQRPQSADRALRALRQTWPNLVAVDDPEEMSFKILPRPSSDFTGGTRWLPTPNALGALLDIIRESCPTKVGNLFDVEQGIKTGLNEAFIVTNQNLQEIAPQEREWYRPIAGGSDIRGGDIQSNRYIFYAVDAFESEDEFFERAPTSAQRMEPYKSALQARRRMNPKLWWEPIWPRKPLAKGGPRILTKMFGSIDLAAPDAAGRYLPLQAYAWVPHWKNIGVADDPKFREAALRIYTRMLNSRVFYLIRREFSTTLAGGQLDLSPKNTNDIPLPTFSSNVLEAELLGQISSSLAASDVNDEFTAQMYGTSIDDWPIRATWAA